MSKKNAFKFAGSLAFVFATFLFASGAAAATPVISLSADSVNLTTGSSTNINWNVTDSVGCMASGEWSGAKDPSGSEGAGPFLSAQSYVFTLTCSGSGGEVESDDVTINVFDPPTLSFFASSTTLEYNTATTLNWSTTNAVSCEALDDWSGAKGVSGPESTGNLISAKKYTLECTGPGGDKVSGSVFIEINSPVAAIELNFSASEYFPDYDQSVDLTWSSVNADACVASGSWTGSKALSDTQNTGNLQSSKFYSLTCTSFDGGSITLNVPITVAAAPVYPPTLTFTAINENIAYASPATLTWVSTEATSCTASGSWTGGKALSDTYTTANLYSTKTYGLTCVGLGGSVYLTVTVNVGPNPNPAPTLNLDVDSNPIPYDTATNINWTSTEATTCTASDDWSGTKDPSGTESTGNLTSDHEYDMTCYGLGGNVSDWVTVVVGDPTTPPVMTFWADDYDINYNTGTVVRWDTEDANWCTLTRGGSSGAVGVDGSWATGNLVADTLYALSCGNAAGTTTQSFTINVNIVGDPPTINLWADQNPVEYGTSTTVRWTTVDATSCTLAGHGIVALNGSINTGTLYSPISYTLQCTGPGGFNSQSLTVTIDPSTSPGEVPDISFWADTYTLLEGENTNLHWTTVDADWCTASGGWSGGRSTSGDENTGDIYVTTSYTITCGNVLGEASASLTIDVGNYPDVALDFWADSYNVADNGYTTLRWDSTNAVVCYTQGGEWGSWSWRALDGTEDVGPLSAYTNVYSLTCENYLYSKTATVTILAGDPPPSIAFYPSTTKVVYNTPVTLFWQATNATYCETWSNNVNEPTWDNPSIEPVGVHTTSNLRAGTRFYIKCYGSGGSSQKDVYVSVASQGTTAPSISFWADNYGVSSGGSTDVHWTTTNATGCRAFSDTDIGWQADTKAINGDQAVGPIVENSNNLYLTCWNGSNGSATVSLNIVTGGASLLNPSMSFWADAYSLASGSSTTLRWNAVNAASCEATGGDWSGAKATGFASESTGAITASKHYELTCSNSGGSITSFVDIVVGGPAVGPTLIFGADDYDIEAGEIVNLLWTSTNATNCYASGGVTADWTGSQPLNGGKGVSPAYSTIFELTCDGPGGSVTKPVPIKVSRVLVCPEDVRVNRLQTRQLTAYYAEDATPGLSCSNLSGTVNISGGLGGFPTDWTTADSSKVSLPGTPGLVYAESYSVAPVNVCAKYKEITGCAGVRVVTTCWECQEGPACVPVGVPADTCPAPYFSDSPSCLSVCSLQWGDWREVTP